jgi:hypothetical protein
LEDRVTRFLESDVVIGRHSVETIDEMSEFEQAPGKVESDETSRAGYEDVHETSREKQTSANHLIIHPAAAWNRGVSLSVLKAIPFVSRAEML